jgi:polyferredoxin
MKKTQLIMIWFLPLILIGGLFFPLLGYIVVGMMAFFLMLAIFKGRFWCWNLCPRGAFLDIVVSKISANKPVPRLFTKEWFRWLIFVLFLLIISLRIISAGGNLFAIGAVFVSACIITTVIALALGVTTKHRSWCVICPMGNLQEKIGRIRLKNK